MCELEELKRQAAWRAADQVRDGDLVGLGTGSTALHAIHRLAERQRAEGLRIQAVSTSWSTTLLCRELGIPLLDTGSVHSLNIAIDGADEIDAQRNLIKGRGAAHLIEKIVASMAKRYLIVADESKKVSRLGQRFPIPLEIHAHALESVRAAIQKLGGDFKIRMGSPTKDGPVISDSGHLIADARFADISDPQALSASLDAIPGLLEHGLFVNLVSRVYLAGQNGIEEF